MILSSKRIFLLRWSVDQNAERRTVKLNAERRPFLVRNNVRLCKKPRRLRIMTNRPSSPSAKTIKDRNLSPLGPTSLSNREWARTWKTAASELEAIRRAEIKSADTATAIVALDDALRSALASLSTRPSSGFVEMQMFFRRLRRDAATD